MKQVKKFSICVLAAAMLAAMSIPAPAAENFGHTTFSLIEAKQNPNNISFSVPLYVTMAVTKDESNVAVPTNYSIANTGKSGGVNVNGEPPFDIAVVKMKFTKLDGGAYSTVTTSPVVGDKNILLRIGEVTMPALSEARTETVALRAEKSQFLEDSTAGGCAVSNWKKIPADPGADPSNPANVLKLDLSGTVAANPDLSDQAAAAQFRVQYTVSALDDLGKPLGRVYAGDDGTEAGLGEAAP